MASGSVKGDAGEGAGKDLGSQRRRRMERRLSWTLLLGLLVSLFLGSLVHRRDSWQGLVPGEATYLMQAESLARDFDLTYTRADFDRHLHTWHGNPKDLALASGSDGRRITYDRPFPYAFWLAPFVALWPQHGFAVANTLLLLLVVLVVTRGIEQRLGPLGPSLVAVLVFGSVLFAYVFLATGDLFLFAVTVMAFGLLREDRKSLEESVEPISGPPPWRYVVAAGLLAIPVATDPLYWVLPVMAFWFPSAALRSSVRGHLTLGFLAGLATQAFVQWLAGGGFRFVGTSRFRFTPETGFPLVDFTPLEWAPIVHRLKAFHWDGAPELSWGFDTKLWMWDLLYLLVGQSIGLLPYFAPLLLLVIFFGRFSADGEQAQKGSNSSVRWVILGGLAVTVLALILLRPFNLYGGPGAIGNRYFLPFYGAAWWLAERPRWPRLRLAPLLALALLLAAPFLWNLWRSPDRHPVGAEGGYKHVTSWAKQFLPLETSQRWLPGSAAVEHNGLMVKFLNENAWAETQKKRLMVDGSQRVDVLIGSEEPLDVIRLELGKEAPSQVEVTGGTLGQSVLLSNGGIAFRILPQESRRHHPMWWTHRRQHLYLLSFALPKADQPLPFQLLGENL